MNTVKIPCANNENTEINLSIVLELIKNNCICNIEVIPNQFNEIKASDLHFLSIIESVVENKLNFLNNIESETLYKTDQPFITIISALVKFDEAEGYSLYNISRLKDSPLRLQLIRVDTFGEHGNVKIITNTISS